MMNAQSCLHWSAQFRSLIKTIEPLGSFVHQDKLTNVPQLMPHVNVEGIGRLGFPILDLVVHALVAKSTKAPYGHLDKTLLNTEVRDAWQIDATKLTIDGGDVWTKYFTEAVRNHCFKLGISEERFETLGIQAKLYKMLIYDDGGHFLSHRDKEKEPHMFGTFLLQLPTSDGFTGGKITVLHRDATEVCDSSIGSDNEFYTVSFYADCEHELQPIVSGKRVCLAFNLVATTPKETLSIPSHAVNIDTEKKLRRSATIGS